MAKGYRLATSAVPYTIGLRLVHTCAIAPSLQYALLLAPVILYGLFNVYRNIYNPKATFLVRRGRGLQVLGSCLLKFLAPYGAWPLRAPAALPYHAGP